MSAPRGLIMDFGGVLTTDFFGALRAFCVREGLSADAIEQLVRKDPQTRAALVDAECGRLSQREFDAVLGQGLGIEHKDLSRRAGSDLRPCQPALDLVARAKAAGVRTALLSNSWGAGDGDVYDIYQGYDLEALFDTVVISHRVGLRKPEEAIYQLVLDKIGLAPEECLFADDNQSHLPPAEKLGMTTVYFTDPDEHVAEIERLLGLA